MQVRPKTLNALVNNKSLVRMLTILDRQKSDGYPTRKLLEKLGSNELHSLISQAEREGYIKREKRKPKGKGNHLMYNYLTKKGKALVTLARKVPQE